MLVLSRKKEESVLIQVPGREDIRVTVVRIDGPKIRLGFDAESDVTIVREELLTATEFTGEGR